MEFESGALDVEALFKQADRSYNDQNYIDGLLVHCFEGFTKLLLGKIWSLFNDTHLAKTLYQQSDRRPSNAAAAQVCADLFSFHKMAQMAAISEDSESMLGINASDSLLQIEPVSQMSSEKQEVAD